MRIVYLADARLPTEKAHGLQVMQMCRALALNGHEVTLVVPARKNPITQTPWEFYGMEPLFRIVRVPLIDFIPYDRLLGRLALWLTSAQFVWNARAAMAEADPDVVYTRDPFSVLSAPRAAACVFEAHDFPTRVTWLHRRLWRRCRRLVAVTEGLRKKFVEAGVPAAKTQVAHDAVDPERFAVAQDRAAARAELGLPKEGFLALYTGHLYPYKGADDALEASTMLERGMKVVFVGGRDADLARLKAKAAELKAKDAEFIGRVPHARIPLWLRAADVCLLPTRAADAHAADYLSPMKLFEYLAAGRAVVATDLPSVREVLGEGEAEFVPPGDPKALAAKLNALRAEPERLAELEWASLRLAQKHTWRNRAEAVVAELTRTEERRGWLSRHRAEILVVALAFLVRLLYIGVFPQVALGGGDAGLYIDQADWLRGAISWEAIAEKRGAGVSPYVQPGYPLFLAAVRTLFGKDLFWVRLIQAAVSAATVLAMMRLAEAAVSRRAALAAGLLGAFHVPMIVESGVPYTETLYAFLLTLGGLFAFRAATTRSAGWALAAGAAMAAAGATRELGFYTAALFALYLLAAKRSPKLFAVFLIPVVLAAGAISLRNRQVAETYVLQTPPLIAKRYEKTLEDPNSRRMLLAPERWPLYAEGVIRFFRLPHRLPDVSSGVALKQAMLEGDWKAVREAREELLMKAILVLLHWLLLLLAAVGFLSGKVKKEARWLVAIAVGFAMLSIIAGSVARLQGFAAFEPLARYRFPIEPLLLVLSAAGLVVLENSRTRRDRPWKGRQGGVLRDSSFTS